MTSATRALLAVTLAATFGRADNPTRLQRVWEYHLSDSLKAFQVDHAAGLPVFAVRFSSDGKYLAVVADRYGSAGQERSRLLILDVLHPEKHLSSFEIDGSVDESLDGPTASFAWSSSGESIGVAGAVIQIQSGKTCTLPRLDGMIGDHLAISFDSPYSWSAEPTRITLFDESCELLDTWTVEERWMLMDVSVDKGLLLVRAETTRAKTTEFLVLDPRLHKVLRRWPANLVHGRKFADHGKAICTGGGVYSRARVPEECFSLESGAELAEAPTINGGYPFATASGAPRLIASSYKRRFDIYSDDLFSSFLDRRVIWDFGAGKELASWRPSDQTYNQIPSCFAISPDGKFVAEGGNGVVDLTIIP